MIIMLNKPQREIFKGIGIIIVLFSFLLVFFYSFFWFLDSNQGQANFNIIISFISSNSSIGPNLFAIGILSLPFLVMIVYWIKKVNLNRNKDEFLEKN